MDGSTLIVVPVLRRPHRVEPLLASIVAATGPPNRILFVATIGDHAELEALDAAGADYLTTPPATRGDYARKINAAYRSTSDEFLFLAADDLAFHAGWLEAALAPMADPAVGVVGTNDLGNARTMSGAHSTHSLVRRSYVDLLGTIDCRGQVLYEGYPHEFVDDELVATARHRHAFVSAGDSHVEHLHPLWGKAPTDALYDAHAQRMRAGRTIFARRSRLWR